MATIRLTPGSPATAVSPSPGAWRSRMAWAAALALPALLLAGVVSERPAMPVSIVSPLVGAPLGLQTVVQRAIGSSERSFLIGRRVLLRARDLNARYPLRIDPFFQQGPKLTGSGGVGPAWFGLSVALSANGTTALVGGPQDDPGQNGPAGAAWVFTRSGSGWAQQGPKLTPTGVADQGALGTVEDWFGYSVALSGDGNTALIGGPDDPNFVGGCSEGVRWVDGNRPRPNASVLQQVATADPTLGQLLHRTNRALRAFICACHFSSPSCA
jgi:FG-GAP repeat